MVNLKISSLKIQNLGNIFNVYLKHVQRQAILFKKKNVNLPLLIPKETGERKFCRRENDTLEYIK